MKREYKHYIILILVSLIIILIPTLNGNLFGSNTDWLNQHIIFPEYLRDLFYKTGDLFPDFSLNLGAGQNIYNISYYGLMSPIILVSYLFPFIEMVDYIVISSILCVFTSGILLYKWLKKNNYNSNVCLTVSLLFLLSSPFIFHMHRHIMFVNYMPFLILSLMGVDKHFDSKKSILLSISIFLMIMTSYYYSVVGIICVTIYAIYKYLKITKKIDLTNFIKEAFRYAIPIVIGVLMSGILIIPTMYSILNGRTNSDAVTSILEYMVIHIDFDILLYGKYSIGLTAISFVSLIYLLISKKIENVFLGISILIFSIFPIIIYLLNGLLYYRAKALIPLLLIGCLMIANFLTHLFNKEIDIIKFIKIVIVCGIIVVISDKNILLMFDLLLILVVIYIYNISGRENIVLIPLCIFSFFVCVYNGFSEDYVSKENYKKLFKSSDTVLIKKILNSDRDFYRFNNLNNYSYGVNKIYDMSYYTTSFYSSVYNKEYKDFYYDLFNNANPYYNEFLLAQTNNIMFQTLMGIKYLVNDSAPIGYELIDSIGDVNVYKNSNVFSLGYATNRLMSSSNFSKIKYPHNIDFLLNNIIIDKNVENSFKSSIKKTNLNYKSKIGENIRVSKESNGYRLLVSELDSISLKLDEAISNKILFISFNGLKSMKCNFGDLDITINGITNKLTCSSWIYHNKNYGFEYVLSSNEPIDTISITFSKGIFDIKNIKIHTLDYDYIKTAVNNIDSFEVDMIKTKGDKIVGNINVTNDGYFATTIPYDKGFTILVDGKLQEYEKVNQGFIGFEIKSGYHEIIMTYKSPFSNVGFIVSLVGMFGFVILIVKDNYINEKIKQ